MPLRDHFHPPLSDRRSWDGLHGGWPMMIVADLNRTLPERYVAEPQVHLGSSFEIDVATYDQDDIGPSWASETGGGISTATWAPPQPTLAVATDLPDVDEYEVRVYDTKAGRRLVAAVEIVSPANKDRPEHRRAFVAKCTALLLDNVCVAIVNLVTSRTANLFREMIEPLGVIDPSPPDEPRSLYAVACRLVRREANWLLEAWSEDLEIGRPLPTQPLWLGETTYVPLELESSYEETCRILRLP